MFCFVGWDDESDELVLKQVFWEAEDEEDDEMQDLVARLPILPWNTSFSLCQALFPFHACKNWTKNLLIERTLL